MTSKIAVPSSPVDALPVELDYITEELKAKAASELNENDNTRIECLKSLRALLKKEDNLRWQDDDLFLLSFLRAGKFDVKKAFDLIKGLYLCIGKHGHIYYNFTFEYLNKIMRENMLTFLPYRDREGCVILLARIGVWNPDVNTAEEHLVSGSLGVLEALRSPSTQIAGFQIIMDYEGCSVGPLFRVSFGEYKLFGDLMQHTVPMRIRGIHAVNQNFFFTYTWGFLSLFLSKKIRERVHIHGKNFKSLHKHFHPSILPANWGGELPPFDNSDWRQRMEESSDYIKHVLSFGYEKYLKKFKKN